MVQVVTSPMSFTAYGNGTVTDSTTGLIWQQTDDNTSRLWQPSIDYCNALTLGGSSNWRLPSIDELLSLIDTSSNPVIDPLFTGVDLSYWSSTTWAEDFTKAWYVGIMEDRSYAYQ